jgi:hypothetical protein
MRIGTYGTVRQSPLYNIVRRPVFNAATWIEHLQFCQHFTPRIVEQTREVDYWRLPYAIKDTVKDHFGAFH